MKTDREVMLGFTMAVDQSDSRTQPCHVRINFQQICNRFIWLFLLQDLFEHVYLMGQCWGYHSGLPVTHNSG